MPRRPRTRPTSHEKTLRERVIDHIGRYRLTFLEALAQTDIFEGNLESAQNAISDLRRAGEVVTHPLAGRYNYHQLTKAGAAGIGRPNAPKPLAGKQLRQCFAVLWFCCLGDHGTRSRHRVFNMDLPPALAHHTTMPFCIERPRHPDGPKSVLRIRYLGPNSKPDQVVRDLLAEREEFLELGLEDELLSLRLGWAIIGDYEDKVHAAWQACTKKGLHKLEGKRIRFFSEPTPTIKKDAIERMILALKR